MQEKIRIFNFTISNIMCIGCVIPLENSLKTLKEVIHVNISWVEKPAQALVYVKVSDESEEQLNKLQKSLEEALDNCGYPYEFISNNYIPSSVKPISKPNSEATVLVPFYKGALSISFGILILLLTALGFSLPFWGLVSIGVMSSLINMYVGKDTFLEAYRNLRYKKLTMDGLFAASTLLSLVISWLALLIPGLFHLHMMFETGLLILGSRQWGIFLEKKYSPHIKKITYKELAPKIVTLMTKEGDEIKNYPVSSLKIGDQILIGPREVIPLDGLFEGKEEVSVYKTDLNGNPEPLTVKYGEKLLAGMQVGLEKPLLMKVEKLIENSELNRQDKIIQESLQKKAQIEKESELMLPYFLKIVVILALISAFFIGIFSTPILAIHIIILSLTAACPCVLGFVLSFTLQIGIYKAYKREIEFRGNAHLEAISKIDTIVLDMHGTLTEGVNRITEIIFLDEAIKNEDVYSYIYALEKGSEHYIAKTICRKEEILKSTPIEVEDIKYSKNGVKGKIDNKIYEIGNADFLKEKKLPEHTKDGHIIYLAQEKKIIAYLVLKDTLRPDVVPALQYLNGLGIRLEICTGADKETCDNYVEIIRKELKFNPFSEIKPSCKDKHEYLRSKSNKKIAFIGDSGNDGPAVTEAYVGIAVSSPLKHRVTQANAGIVICNNENSLIRIVQSVLIAKQTMKNLRYFLGFNLTYNAIILTLPTLLLIFVGIMLPPYLGAVLMLSQLVLVFLSILYTYTQPVPTVSNNKKELSFSSYESILTAQQDKKPTFPIQPSKSRNFVNLVEEGENDRKYVGSNNAINLRVSLSEKII